MLGGLYAKKPDVSNLLAQEIGQLLTKFLSKWYYFYRAHLLWNSSPLNLFHLPITLIKSYSKWYHYDNIAPALLGGLQLMQPGGSCVPLPFFENWLLVLYHPGIKISTRMARDILPKNLPRGAVIPYWQKLAGFIRGLYTGDQALAESLLYDDVIEPYRANLIPRFEEGKKAAREAGAVAFGIAGSGPTCFAIVHSMDKAVAVQSALVREMKGTQESFSKICTLSPQGARVLKEM